MMISIINARKVNNFLVFDVCPNAIEEGCGCEVEGLHHVYTFPSEPPEWQDAENKTISMNTARWTNHCANEALHLVHHHVTEEAVEELPKLIGKHIK